MGPALENLTAAIAGSAGQSSSRGSLRYKVLAPRRAVRPMPAFWSLIPPPVLFTQPHQEEIP